MGKIKGIQIVNVDTLTRVNELLEDCIDLCEAAISSADSDQLHCRNFKGAVQGWVKFKAFVQFVVGVAHSAELDLQTENLALHGVSDPTGRGNNQTRGQVDVSLAKELVSAMKGYVSLNREATTKFQELGITSLDARNFRQALDGGASFAQFARSIAGTLHVQPLLDELLDYRKAAEVKRAKATLSKAVAEFKREQG